jgi:hypothetical protein
MSAFIHKKNNAPVKAPLSLRGKPPLPLAEKLEISGDPAGRLKRAVMPVLRGLSLLGGKSVHLARAFATAATGAGAAVKALARKDIKGAFKRAALGAAEAASEAVFGMDTSSLAEKVREVSARLKDKKFVSATAIALAAATQIGAEIVGKPVLGFALSTAIVMATHALFGTEETQKKRQPAYAVARL